uniref:Uncharacterized protein n=1 Tax=Peronospora matthiolae TaxID=2874970 RepID=A0AAV1TCF3_9STRA
MDSDVSIGIQRMSLGPSEAAHPLYRVEMIKIEPRSTTTGAKRQMTSTRQGNMQAYLDEAIKRFQQDQRELEYQAIYPSQLVKPVRVQEPCTPDVDMELVRSHISRSEFYNPEDADPDYPGKEERRRAIEATTDPHQEGGTIPQRTRVSAMTELN